MPKDILKDYVVPLFLFVFFFVVQVFVKPSESTLTVLAVLFSVIIFLLETHKNELKVFLFGLVLGSFIEIVLGLVARQQYWENASLFGVPTWLPITWGIGFVVITRLGLKIEGFKYSRGK